MKLKDIAHIRTGDKGNHCNICVIPYDQDHYTLLKSLLTATLVKEYYQSICNGPVKRYDADNICALNFVLHDILNGGVTKSLSVDKHGKSLGYALLELDLDTPLTGKEQ